MTIDLVVLRQLQHAFTRYDIRLSKGKFYNPYALSKYLEIAGDAAREVARGEPIRTALTRRLNDRLLNVALKAVGEPPATRDEIRGIGQWLPR